MNWLFEMCEELILSMVSYLGIFMGINQNTEITRKNASTFLLPM